MGPDEMLLGEAPLFEREGYKTLALAAVTAGHLLTAA